MDTVGSLAFLLKAVNFRERVLQRGLVARIYYKVKKRGVIFFLLAYSCIAAKCNRGWVSVITSFWKGLEFLPAFCMTALLALEALMPTINACASSFRILPPSIICHGSWWVGVIFSLYWSWTITVSMCNEYIFLKRENVYQAYVKINHWISLGMHSISY